MPLALLTVPDFVTVPIALGVPVVTRALVNTLAVVTSLETDALDLLSLFLGPQWGIFDSDGNPAIVGDSVISQEFSREWRISGDPIEPNSFQNYNKVEVPYDVRFMFTKGGTVADREQFLIDVDSACSSLDLFSGVSPEATYPNINPYKYDYRREREGAGLLKVDVYCLKIRETASSAFGNSAQPQTASPVQNGPVQTTPLEAGSAPTNTAFA